MMKRMFKWVAGVFALLALFVADARADAFADATNGLATVQTLGTSGMTWGVGIFLAVTVLGIIALIVRTPKRAR